MVMFGPWEKFNEQGCHYWLIWGVGMCVWMVVGIVGITMQGSSDSQMTWRTFCWLHRFPGVLRNLKKILFTSQTIPHGYTGRRHYDISPHEDQLSFDKFGSWEGTSNSALEFPYQECLAQFLLSNTHVCWRRLGRRAVFLALWMTDNVWRETVAFLNSIFLP